MKHCCVIAVAAWALLPALAQAQGAIAQSPEFLVVSKVDREKGQLILSVARFVPKAVTRIVEDTIVQNGKAVKVLKPVVENVPVKEEMNMAWFDTVGRAFDGNGKQLLGKTLFDRVKAGSVVLMHHGPAIDPRILTLVRPDAVILTTPAVAAAPFPDPRPAPAPVPVPAPAPVVPPGA